MWPKAEIKVRAAGRTDPVLSLGAPPTGMSDDDHDPAVPVVRPDCDTETHIPLDDLPGKLDRHNEQRHDGEEVAQMDPDLADRLLDLAADDVLSSEQGRRARPYPSMPQTSSAQPRAGWS